MILSVVPCVTKGAVRKVFLFLLCKKEMGDLYETHRENIDTADSFGEKVKYVFIACLLWYGNAGEYRLGFFFCCLDFL